MSGMLDAARTPVSLKSGLSWVSALLGHASWWLEWRMRVRAGDGSRALTQSQEVAAPRERAA
ncbi:MAG TPA: hypothetical protein VFQ12_08975 [Thermoleophilaceae bacterium]|nr:hypothetical protein [Thermoleophilaceae bacterium]